MDSIILFKGSKRDFNKLLKELKTSLHLWSLFDNIILL